MGATIFIEGTNVHLEVDRSRRALSLLWLATFFYLMATAVGKLTWQVVQLPTGRSVTVLVVVFGITVPALTGAVDLYLRLHTP